MDGQNSFNTVRNDSPVQTTETLIGCFGKTEVLEVNTG
jgi:hypothetical protein